MFCGENVSINRALVPLQQYPSKLSKIPHKVSTAVLIVLLLVLRQVDLWKLPGTPYDTVHRYSSNISYIIIAMKGLV